MTRILLPSDFSDTALKAAHFAMDLHGTGDVRYTLVNSTPVRASADPLLPDLTRLMEQNSLSGLRQVERRLRKRTDHVYLAKVSTYAPLPEALNNLAERKGGDLIVMGTQGKSSNRLFGSTKLRSKALCANSRRVYRSSSVDRSSSVCSPWIVSVSSSISTCRSFLSKPGACISTTNASARSVMFTRVACSRKPSPPKNRPMLCPKISEAKRSTGEVPITGPLYFTSAILICVLYLPDHHGRASGTRSTNAVPSDPSCHFEQCVVQFLQVHCRDRRVG